MDNIKRNDDLEIDIENKYVRKQKNTQFTTEEAIYILKRKDFCDEIENIAIENLIQENKELKEYDYRNIKLDEKNKISSIHFTKEQLDLMNLGIALYVGIPKILADEEDEESDI